MIFPDDMFMLSTLRKYPHRKPYSVHQAVTLQTPSGVASPLNPGRLFEADWDGMRVRVLWKAGKGSEVTLIVQAAVFDPMWIRSQSRRGIYFNILSSICIQITPRLETIEYSDIYDQIIKTECPEETARLCLMDILLQTTCYIVKQRYWRRYRLYIMFFDSMLYPTSQRRPSSHKHYLVAENPFALAINFKKLFHLSCVVSLWRLTENSTQNDSFWPFVFDPLGDNSISAWNTAD